MNEPHVVSFLDRFIKESGRYDETCEDGQFHLIAHQHGWEIFVRDDFIVSLWLHSGIERDFRPFNGRHRSFVLERCRKTSRCPNSSIDSMADYDGNSIVLRCCDAISERTRFDADLSKTRLADLNCAIVFVNAFWSYPSIAALSDLADIIYELDPVGTLSLIVCDTDCIPSLADTEWGLHTTRGIGEMAWICGGTIVARHHDSHYSDIRVSTRSLLADCPI